MSAWVHSRKGKIVVEVAGRTSDIQGSEADSA